MATNQLLPFGTGGGANVLDFAGYQNGNWRLTGFTAGTAVSQQLNTVWRQSSFVAAMIGQFTADYSGQNVVDDGNVATFETNFVAAIPKATRAAPFYGLQATPATTFNVASGVSTDITTFGTTQNGLSGGTTFTSGVLTIGSNDAGYYLLANWLGTNLPIASGYGWTQAIGVSTDNGSTYFSKGGIAGITNPNATNGPFAGFSTVLKLNAGDKIKNSLTHNYGSTLNAPCGFSAVFLGR